MRKLCKTKKKPCMFIQKEPFFHDRACVLCMSRSVPCIKHPNMPITQPQEYTLTDSMWKILSHRPKKPQGKDTKEWKPKNRLSLANTQILAKQSLTTAQNDQPQPNQPKRKWLKTALANESHNSELTRQIILNSQSQCSKQGCSLQTTPKKKNSIIC